MNEMKKTLIYAGSAVVLLLIAYLVTPKRITPEMFQDQGEKFFPDFTDPNKAMTLEVIEYDENAGAAKPFKVTFENNKWTIPSEYDYPADAKDRLAKTAAGIIELRKDEFRTDNVSEHAATGVIDPLDENAGLTGRGTRVTIKGNNQVTLADIIIGNEIPGHKDMRFVRLPDEKRVYASKVDFDLSTKFNDWINTDLLQVDKRKINNVELQDYSINEQTGSLDNRDVIRLSKNSDTWKANKMPSGKEVDKTKIDNLLSTLGGLKIVGVRPKPEGVSASLEKLQSGDAKISSADMRSLQQKGFFFTRDGKLVSNEGELAATTDDGVHYTLRFGEVVYGDNEDASNQKSGPNENRYLFVTAKFDPKLFPEPKKPSNMDFEGKADSLLTSTDLKNKTLDREHKQWEQKINSGKKEADALNKRFANWYYIISSDSFDKLHYTRKDLIVSKKDN